MEGNRTQSVGLSERHLQYHQDGNHLSQDSIESEANLKEAMVEIKIYAKSKLESHGLRYEYYEKLSTYDIQKIWHSHGGPEPNPDPKNKTTNIRPDGGIIMAILPNNLRYPYSLVKIRFRVAMTSDFQRDWHDKLQAMQLKEELKT